MLFNNRERFGRYLKSILIGLPTWFVIGVLVTFSNDFGKAMGIKEPIDPGKAIMYAYAAIAVGDVLIGFVSQYFKSRKKALYLFYGFTILSGILFSNVSHSCNASDRDLIFSSLIVLVSASLI